MAGQTTFRKRERAKALQERAAEKRAKRKEKSVERANRGDAENPGEDPDIAGIVPGPQPIVEG